MRIGLIIAVEKELKAFLDYGGNIEEEIVNNRKVYKTTIHGHDIVAIRSGCGIIDASSATQLLISKYDVELMLNFGVSGALDKSLKVEDLFVVNKTLHYEYDISPIDPLKRNQYEEFDDEYIPLNKKYIDLAKSVDPSLKDATVASGGLFIADKGLKTELFEKGCNICDMEIAGIARTCFLANIDCLSIKCISDTFDGCGADYEANVSRSASSAFKVLSSIISKL